MRRSNLCYKFPRLFWIDTKFPVTLLGINRINKKTIYYGRKYSDALVA